jgi:hypothetical protein
LYELMDELPVVHLPNRFFENDGHAGTDGESLHFTERTGTWASSKSGISNGAVFADLDRDGDLDLVTNNVNDEATLLENRANERSGAHALRVELHGPKGNRSGLGTEVRLTNDGTTQSHDHSPYRGYQSTVEGIVHFGLGADSTADSLAVTWPDGTTQLRTDVAARQVLDVHYDSAASTPDSSLQRPSDSALFRTVAAQRGLTHRHRETGGRERNALLPHQYTKNGPGIAVGDVDGNGLDDIFVGADRGRERVLYRQTAPGEFQQRALAMKHRYSGKYGYEDMGALFFDAEGDGDLDLYVVSGSNVGPLNTAGEAYQDRLYLNDGSGQFRRAEGALPDVTTSGSVVTAADYDRDGDLDLFVGGRVRPSEYPLPPRSYVLRNDSGENGVQFTDVTAEVAPGLSEVGLVTDALWTDYNGDGRTDLLVVGEWRPITLFENTGDQFTDVTDEVGLQNTSGWWNSLVSGDFDRDGDSEYVAGNLGLNTRYEASSEEPVRVHAKDFDRDGQLDPVLSRYVEGTNVPAHNYKELTTQLRRMGKRFPSHRAYAEASFDDVFPASDLEGSYEATAVRFETTYLDPTSDGTFSLRALPRPVQMAPVFGMQTGDYNDDGHLDLLAVGNWYAPDAETGRADASIGTVLRGTGTGHFDPIPYPESGFLVEKDTKGLSTVATGSDSALVVAVQNNDSLRVFAPTHRRGRFVPVRPLDRYAMLTYENGSTRREELHYGSTYLSQSSRQLWVPASVTKVVIHGAEGTRHVALGQR